MRSIESKRATRRRRGREEREGEREGAKMPSGKKKALSFVIDCSKPVEDKIMDISSFEKFLLDRIKVEGKTGTVM